MNVEIKHFNRADEFVGILTVPAQDCPYCGGPTEPYYASHPRLAGRGRLFYTFVCKVCDLAMFRPTLPLERIG
jgi:hypothetical protein